MTEGSQYAATSNVFRSLSVSLQEGFRYWQIHRQIRCHFRVRIQPLPLPLGIQTPAGPAAYLHPACQDQHEPGGAEGECAPCAPLRCAPLQARAGRGEWTRGREACGAGGGGKPGVERREQDVAIGECASAVTSPPMLELQEYFGLAWRSGTALPAIQQYLWGLGSTRPRVMSINVICSKTIPFLTLRFAHFSRVSLVHHNMVLKRSRKFSLPRMDLLSVKSPLYT
jgi:hypothetical protein